MCSNLWLGNLFCLLLPNITVVIQCASIRVEEFKIGGGKKLMNESVKLIDNWKKTELYFNG